VAEREWKVKKDGGRITYRTGATVTPQVLEFNIITYYYMLELKVVKCCNDTKRSCISL